MNQNLMATLMFTQQATEFEEQIKKLKAIINEREKEIEEKNMIVKNKDVEISELKDSFEKEKEEMKKEVRRTKHNQFWCIGVSDNLTAPFSNMRTLKFKAQPTNTFFTTVKQMFDGSSQLLTSAKHYFDVGTVLNDLITSRWAVVESWEEPLNI